jgi:hypothetical protein
VNPILYTPDIETVDEDEIALTSEIVEKMAASSRCAFERHRHAIRDAHAKSNGVLKGQLVVHAGLPEELRQGVFAHPRTFDVVARLSSAPGDIHSDEIPAARGFALKILGVEGERIRRAAYERSAAFRHAMNARPRIEPSSAADIPD